MTSLVFSSKRCINDFFLHHKNNEEASGILLLYETLGGYTNSSRCSSTDRVKSAHLEKPVYLFS